MRKILFRGKHKSEWIYGDYVSPSSIEDSIGDIYGVDPETIGQYIDLIDTNGVKIFEGDIVKVYLYQLEEYYDQKECYLVLPVVFENGAFRLEDDEHELLIEDAACAYEVIGNIYDNPELVISRPETPTEQS